MDPERPAKERGKMTLWMREEAPQREPDDLPDTVGEGQR